MRYRASIVRGLCAAATLSLAAGSIVQAHEGPETVHSIARIIQATLSNVPAKTGSGQFTYVTVPNWSQNPSEDGPGPMLNAATHGSIVIDKTGIIYASTDKPGECIRVYEPSGKLLRIIGNPYTNFHGMCINTEEGTEYIYAASTQGRVVKLGLDGKVVWTIEPDQIKKDSGKYDAPAEAAAPAPAPAPKKGDKKEPAKKAGPPALRPTAVAVGPNGDVYIADGYGSSFIHQYSKDRKYIRSFAGRGTEPGKCQACHGISLDTRGSKPVLLVADRENKRLQTFDLDGNFIAVVTENLRRPCCTYIVGDYVAVAELQGRVAILDKSNKVIAAIGDNPNEKQWATNKIDPKDWTDGIFTAPHGVAFDKDHNLYVMDWNLSGRLTKLNLVKQ
jgi:hypothetical protein